MWISRAKWEAMERRVDGLERLEYLKKEAEDRLKNEGAFKRTVYDVSLFTYSNVPSVQLTAWDAIDLILKHLGLSLTMKRGTPDRVELER